MCQGMLRQNWTAIDSFFVSDGWMDNSCDPKYESLSADIEDPKEQARQLEKQRLI